MSEIFVKKIQILSSCREDQLIITLIKLWHNLTFELLAHIGNIGKYTANYYFWKWIDISHSYLQFFTRMGERAQIFQIIPPIFKFKFPRLTCTVLKHLFNIQEIYLLEQNATVSIRSSQQLLSLYHVRHLVLSILFRNAGEDERLVSKLQENLVLPPPVFKCLVTKYWPIESLPSKKILL